FLVGVEEELLPHRTSIEEENIEEERRLAYVGITRARRLLHLTCARKRRKGGELVECEPSRFLEELPAEELEWEGRQAEEDPEKRKARGRAHLASLKAMLE
ncbi:MAG TPA: ATP-dependent DNA helicase Rep, partial [Thiolapillus brandeum]|nr:ATP-dependent DNA helicase Rep [Thiolapillus brandeum]